MIRKPTPMIEQYRWHRAALAGERPELFDGDVHCGWYRRRLVKDGPWVPARVWLVQALDEEGLLAEPEVFLCDVRQKPRDPMQEFSWLASNPISRERYEKMIWDIEWAGQNSPYDPILFPFQALPISKQPTLPGGKTL